MLAIIPCAEEIREGAGHRRIEKLVNAVVHGEEENIVDGTPLVDSEGKVIAHWKKRTLVFEKSYRLDRKNIEQLITKGTSL